MTNAADTPQEPRRLLLRRARSGGRFTSAPPPRVDSFRGGEDPQEPDEIDEAMDPESTRNVVRERAALPPPAQLPTPPIVLGGPPAQPQDAGAAGDDDRLNARQRLNQVAASGSATYAREYRMLLIHRMIMRGVPLDQIARELQVSLSTVERDRRELKRFLAEQAQGMDINEIIGEQNAVYNEVAGMALRVASAQGTPAAMRLGAMRTALAANADRTRMLNTAGVFDALRFRPPQDATNLSDIQILMQRTEEALSRLDEEGDAEEQPTEPPPAPRRRSGTFAPMTFDDQSASGSAQEIEQI